MVMNNCIDLSNAPMKLTGSQVKRKARNDNGAPMKFASKKSMSSQINNLIFKNYLIVAKQSYGGGVGYGVGCHNVTFLKCSGDSQGALAWRIVNWR